MQMTADEISACLVGSEVCISVSVLSCFDWWKSRKIVVQRIIERGWLKDFYAAFKLYGGIEGFREIIKEVPSLSPRDMNFVCVVFNLKKEELKCYTRKLLRDRLLNS